MANPIIKHYGKIAPNGNISFYDAELWANQRMELRGKEFELVIKQRTRRPTSNQFGYYWSGILGTCLTCEMFSHFLTAEDIHKEVFAPQFLSYQTKFYLGKIIYTRTHVRSLGELTKQETNEFIEQVLNWCKENDIDILPADQYVTKFYTEITKK
jgi:hypothetical protein